MTEDSELAIRIHAAGWESQYLTQVYGRGLIPPTFAGYRKQRFRWTYGPVQELRQHWRLFLPCRLGGTPSCLSPGQKLHHANHGIDVASVAVRALAIPLGAVTGFSMLIHHERVPVPVELWCASTSALVGSLVLRYLVYTRVVGATLRQALGGTVAFAALSLVIATASLKSAMGRPVKWLRTDKFPSNRHGLGVLRSARNEAAAAVACVTAAGLLVTFAPVGGVVTMLAIALGMQAATYSAAVGVAAVADLTLPRPSLLFQQRRGRRSSSDRGALRRPYESNNPGPS